ncbi:MAG: CRISPR-associated protein [Chloroflexi bacterium]|nr:CRISPR-associated protein [Chloroflexota bacterium]
MHKRRFNEFTLNFTIRPQGPLLIKSGQESGADPTLLDMNFVRTHHGRLGDSTVYLPGSSLKGTLRSYAEKVARTLGEERGAHFPPFSCNPLGSSAHRGRDDYYCGKYLDKKGDQADKHRLACPICRTFGHTSLASHLRLSDAYPMDLLQPETMTWFNEANDTEERDGVAIDRISGAVAVGPFNLEVVTKGAFQGTLTLSNFQLWQLGLLAIVLRDLGQGRVPIGFGKSRGLGRVTVEYSQAEVAYPGRFSPQVNGRDLRQSLMGVAAFLSPEEARVYDYFTEDMDAFPDGWAMSEEDDGSYGRVALTGAGEAVNSLWRTCVPFWARFVASWRGTPDG